MNTNPTRVPEENTIPGREGNPEKKSHAWLIGPALLIITIGIVIYMIVTDSIRPSDRQIAEEDCRRGCPTYNAEYVRIVEIPRTRDYECWCRRGTEPLRIW